MRFVKILGWTFLGLVVLAVLGAVAILLLVDPNDYKAEIAQKVKAETGRELKIEGNLGLSVFPWLALKLGHAELGNPPGFGSGAFAVIENADVGVRLLPLLSSRLEIGRVRLEGLQLNLAVDAQGRNNWAFGEQDTAATDEKGKVPTLTIAGLTIKDSGLDYVDADAGSHYRITGLGLETGRLRPGEAFDVKLTGALDQGEGTSAVQLKLDTEASLNTDTEQYDFKDLVLDATVQSPPSDSKPATELPVKLRIPALNIDLNEQTLQAPAFELDLASAAVSGNLQGQKIIAEPAFNGRISLKQTSPRELLKAAGIEAPQTRDPQALKTLALDAALNATPNSVELQDLKLKLDDTQMAGRFGVADFDTVALRFDLNVDRIDLDRYLPPSSEKDVAQKSAQDKPSKEAPSKPVELPLDMLKELNATGTFNVGALTLAGVKLAAVKLKIDAENGLVRINPSQAKLYGGTHRGTVALDARGKVASLTLEEHLSGIDFAPVMQELFDSKRLSGRGSTNATLTARGNDSAALIKSLDGRVDFDVANGALEGMDLWYEIRRAEALLRRQPLTGQGTGRTAFKTFKGTATIAKGVLDNRDLSVDMDYLKAAGEGTLNLDTTAIDYRLKTTVYRVPAEGAGSELQNLKSVEIPVRITGTLADLKVRPDLETRIKAEAKKKVEEKKEEIKGKLTDKLNKWLEKKK